jgi:UDP-glucuronate 4-epimerase
MSQRPRTALVTGSAGFIGYHLCRRLLADGFRVTGLDAMTEYYDVRLKERRHALLAEDPGFRAEVGRLEDAGRLAGLMAERPEIVVHLAAQAGVRYSLEAPRSYVEANLVGSFELLEAARAHPPAHLLMASTSSVYGANAERPYAETHKADWPLSLYAATKKANEAMAHSYAHLYGLPVTMFRFFTVYGPWGRPDMALFKFTKAILEGEPIDVYNRGDMARDFTYVDDLVEGIRRLIDVPPPAPGAEARPVEGDSLSPAAPWRIVNIGNSTPVRLGDFIAAIEAATGRRAERRLLPMQPGDVPETWADARLLTALTGYRPQVDLAEGVRRFVAWYREYYGV